MIFHRVEYKWKYKWKMCKLKLRSWNEEPNFQLEKDKVSTTEIAASNVLRKIFECVTRFECVYAFSERKRLIDESSKKLRDTGKRRCSQLQFRLSRNSTVTPILALLRDQPPSRWHPKNVITFVCAAMGVIGRFGWKLKRSGKVSREANTEFRDSPFRTNRVMIKIARRAPARSSLCSFE